MTTPYLYVAEADPGYTEYVFDNATDQYDTAAKPKLPTAAEQVKAPSAFYKIYGY